MRKVPGISTLYVLRQAEHLLQGIGDPRIAQEVENLRHDVQKLIELCLTGGSSGETVAEAALDILCPKIDSVVARARF